MRQFETGEVTQGHIEQDNVRRGNLGLEAQRKDHSQYRGMYAIRFAAFELYNINEEKAAIPYNVPGQQILKISE